MLDLNARSLTAARQHAAGRNLAAAVALLQARVPGLAVRVGALNDPRPAWWAGGTVYVNTAPGRADTSSPLHELSEVWGAAYQTQEPAAYAAMLNLVRDSPAHQQARRAYPELDDENQLREALHLQVQEVAAASLDQRQDRVARFGAVGQLWNYVGDLLARLGARLQPRQLADLLEGGHLTNAELTQALAHTLLTGSGPAGGLARLTAGDLERLGGYARDQRLNRTAGSRVPGIAHSGDLLTLISGQEPNQSGEDVHARAQAAADIYADEKGFRTLTYDENRVVTKGWQDWTSPHREDRIRQATTFYRQNQALPDGEALAQAKDLFRRLALPRAETTITEEEELLAAQMFPHFDGAAGHQVVHYTAQEFGQHPNPAVAALYDPAFNPGNLLVHLDAQGVPLGVQAITRLRLGEGAKRENLTLGLYQDEKQGFFGKQAARKLAGTVEKVTLSRTPEQLQKLQALLLGMHFNDRGHALLHLGVTNVRDLSNHATNAASTLVPVAELLALQEIRRHPAVRAQLAASGKGGARLLSVLDNDQLYTGAGQGYVTDPIRGLLLNHQSASPAAYAAIGQAVGAYQQTKSEATTYALQQGIRTELIKLTAALSEEERARNPWYVQLAQADRQLTEIEPRLHTIRALGDEEQQALDFYNHPNPAMKLLVAQARTLMGKFTQQWQTLQPARVARIRALRDAHAALPDGARTGGRLREHDQPLYARLQQTSPAWQASADGKTYTQVQVPNGRWILPGTEAFNKLMPAEQAFITEEIAATRQHLIDWHQARHLDVETGAPGSLTEAEAWYEQNWAQGQIPFSPASASTQRLQGNWTDGWQTSIHELLTQNPNFDNAETGARENLGEYYQGQGGNQSVWGNEQKRQMLGIVRTSEEHPETGEPLNFIVQDNWQQLQARYDQDLGRGMTLFAAELLRQQHSQEAERVYAIATAVNQYQEAAAGVVRKYIPGVSGKLGTDVYDEKDAKSNADQVLRAMYRAIFLGDTAQGGGSAGVQRLMKAGAIMTAATRGLLMKGDVLRPIRNLLAQVLGNLAPILATQNAHGDAVLNPKLLKEAAGIALNPKNHNYLYQLAVHLGVSDPSTLSLARSREMNERPRMLSDLLDVDMQIDRSADETMAQTIMVLHMLTNKSWGAYSWDEAGKHFVYDEVQHRQLTSDAHVDAIRQNQVANQLLTPGERMHGGYDPLMLSALEASITGIRGNYSPLSNTLPGTQLYGKFLLPMRRWFSEKVKSATIDNHVSTTKGYRNLAGQWVGQRDEGQWQSLTGFLGRLVNMGRDPMSFAEKWKGMDAADRQNIALFSTKLAGVMSLTLASALLHGLWDDDPDKDSEKKRAKQRGILDAVISEASVFANLQFLTDAAASPFLIATYGKQMATGVGQYLSGDIKGGNRTTSSKLGFLKAKNRIENFFSSQDDSQTNP
ncbi:MAG: hypothetical protein NVS3B25_30950 [Hymenobacter sp.]